MRIYFSYIAIISIGYLFYLLILDHIILSIFIILRFVHSELQKEGFVSLRRELDI